MLVNYFINLVNQIF